MDGSRRGASIGRGGGTEVVKSGIFSLLGIAWSLLLFFHCCMAESGLCDRLFSLFQELDLLKWASVLREEEQQLEVEGLQKVKLAVAGSEAEGLYRLLMGAVSHSSMSSAPPLPKRCHHAPTATVSKPPIRSPKELNPKPPLLWLSGLDWCQRPPP